MLLSDAFHETIRLLAGQENENRENDGSTDGGDDIGGSFRNSLSTSEQLHLYGLYKHATSVAHDAAAQTTTATTTTSTITTTTTTSEPPSRWNIRESRKHQAWQNCAAAMTVADAMTAYLQFVVERLEALETPNAMEKCHAFVHVRDKCRALLQGVVETPTKDDDDDDENAAVGNGTNGLPPTRREDGNVNHSIVEDAMNETMDSLPDSRKDDAIPMSKHHYSSSSWWSHPFTFLVTVWWGIPPLIPRGQLDISGADLWFAMVHCVAMSVLYPWRAQQRQYMILQAQIMEQWRNALLSRVDRDDAGESSESTTSDATRSPPPVPASASIPDVMVGLSVRSLLDLYLRVKQYPPGSQVIVTPPINVPGILQVLAHHELCVVGVDIPSHDDDNNNATDAETTGTVTVAVDCAAIARAVTPHTVAILVVHVFGMVTATDADFAELRQIVASSRSALTTSTRPIAIWEDCAECFAGLMGDQSYLGSPYADVSFFSFGIIKTMTALGGGIALSRSTSMVNRCTGCDESQSVVEAMRRLHGSSAYEPPNLQHWQFFVTVVKCTILHAIAEHPVLYGLIFYVLDRLCGLNFDGIVTGLVRSFRLQQIGPERRSALNSRTVLNRVQMNGMIHQIRRRPSPVLMALLHRRLSQSTRLVQSVAWRVKTYGLLTKLLRQKQNEGCRQVQIPSPKLGARHFYWLYPVMVEDPIGESSRLLRCGYDVTQGVSQLVCVDHLACPRAAHLMQRLLYLPVSHKADKSFGDNRTQQIVRAIYDKRTEMDVQRTTPNDPSQSWRGRNCCLIVTLLAIIMLPRWLTLSLAVIASRVILFPLVALCAIVWILRVCMGRFYVHSSKAVAKHCDLLDYQTQREKETNAISSPSGILSSLKTLELHPCLDQRERRRTVILSGGTGFLGSLVLRDLLLYRDLLNIEYIFVLCRVRKGRSGKERLDSVLSDAMYSFLLPNERDSLVQVIEGDATAINAGMHSSDIDRLRTQYNITHFINCAASVSFNQSLRDAATANVSSSLNLQNLATLLNSTNVQFVQISTAFVHGGQSGESNYPLPQILHPLGNYCPFEIYKSMCTTQFYASKAMQELGFANTYTFSKCIGEHLLLTNDPTTIIIRPSIVGPAIEAPYEGWAGRVPSTLVAAASLYLSYQWNLWSFGSEKVPCIPVDVVSRYILAKVFKRVLSTESEVISDEASSDGSFEKLKRPSSPESSCSQSDNDLPPTFHIYTAAWDTRSPSGTCFTWSDYAGAVTQFGTFLGYFNRSTAYFGLLMATKVLPRMRLSSKQFEMLHRWTVKTPFTMVHNIFDVLGYNSKAMHRLKMYLDLPMLFFPFMDKEFHFESDLIAPPQLCGERYLASCVAAAHFFVAKADKSHESERRLLKRMSEYSIGDASRKTLLSRLYWVLAQPFGNALVRVAAFILCSVLQRCFSDITVDIASFSAAHKAKDSLDSACFVLAPTHRSYFDFLLLSYVCFSLPELHIGIPYIAAADSFEFIPILGRVLGFLGAFFVRRGRRTVDPDLSRTIRFVKKQQTTFGPAIEVFIEGTRSRDRRFLYPKTGVLRCLRDAGGQYVIIPLAISYELVAEQEDMVHECVRGVSSKIHVGSIFAWLARALQWKTRLGRVHICACDPLVITDTVEPDWKSTVFDIQRRQVEAVVVTDFHIAASCKLLGLDRQIVRSAFGKLGVKFLRTTSPEDVLNIPSDSSELVSLLLQTSPNLAVLFRNESPLWAEWLHPSSLRQQHGDIDEDVDLKLLSKSLLSLFHAADRCVDAAISLLKAKGFTDPEHRHIFQVCEQQTSGVPALLLDASIRIKRTYRKPVTSNSNRCKAQRVVGRCTSSAETLGCWGFSDSSFVIGADSDGTPFVSFSGDRYDLHGKKIKGLISFIESETRVKLNPLDEAFSRESKVRYCTACHLSDEDVALLKTSISLVSILDEDRLRHGTGHSQEDVFAIRSGALLRVPDAVVWPASEDDISKVVSLAIELQWCIVPFGGGTNVSQATRCPVQEVEPRPIISLDMRKMNKVIWIDEINGLANVEAGITGQELEEEMLRRGYTMGHEPDSKEFSTLGGWIATKASGMKRNKYGNIEDIVKAVRVIGPNGLLRHGSEYGSHVWGRESSAMDLCSVVLGSEGCLGIITSAVIRIWPLPEVTQYDSILLRDFGEGLEFVRKISKLGQNIPASARLLDNEHFRLGRALQPETNMSVFTTPRVLLGTLLSHRAGFERDSVVCATIAYEGTREEVAAQKSAILRLVARHGGLQLGQAMGKSGYELTFMIAYLRDFAMTFHFLSESFETFAPWSQIETIISKTKERIRREHMSRCLPGQPFVGSRVTQLYHEGACIYFYFCMSFHGVENASSVYAEIEHAARSEVLLHGGSLSHHHGIGKLRSSFLKDINSVPWQDTMKSIKKGFDPSNVFGARNGAFAT